MLPDLMLEPSSLAVTSRRVRVSIRMPWYRALPLSSVASVTLTVDGLHIPTDGMTWTCDGTTLAMSDLPARHDLWWYVLDSAVLEGDRPQDLPGAGSHEVELALGLYIPYITTALGVLRIEEHDRKLMSLGTR